jgi:hypothetical protein
LEEDDDENGASAGDTKKSSAFSRSLKLQIVRLVYMLGDEDEVRVGGLLTFLERA